MYLPTVKDLSYVTNTKRKVQREMARNQHFPEPLLIVPHPHHTWRDPLGETARS